MMTCNFSKSQLEFPQLQIKTRQRMQPDSTNRVLTKAASQAYQVVSEMSSYIKLDLGILSQKMKKVEIMRTSGKPLKFV